MPYEIRKRGDRWCVFKEGADADADPLGCHDTEDAARRQQAALYANEPAAKSVLDSDDTLILYGESVKALGDGEIGGVLAPFGSPEDADAHGDFFTAATDFGLDVSPRARVIYQHGFTKAFGRKKLGVVGMGVDPETGLIAIEPIKLNISDPAQRDIYAKAEAGDLYWSTGTAPHLMVRRRVGKAREILEWPVSEASLTPRPANGRAVAMALKAIIADDPDIDIEADTISDSLATGGLLIDDLPRLAADLRRIGALATKARDQRRAEGRDLSPEKVEALKALPPELRDLAEVFDGLCQPADHPQRPVPPDRELSDRIKHLLATHNSPGAPGARKSR